MSGLEKCEMKCEACGRKMCTGANTLGKREKVMGNKGEGETPNAELPTPNAEGGTIKLNDEHIAIMRHTATRAARGMYCGDSPEMKDLTSAGLMVCMGKPAYCHDPYFSLTAAGKAKLAEVDGQ